MKALTILAVLLAAAACSKDAKKDEEQGKKEDLSGINIDLGRQLFVDDFLIGETDLTRVSHQAKKYDGNPIFEAETEWEKINAGNKCAIPFDGGVWWDPKAGYFKMWYEAGYCKYIAYAKSPDGIHWSRPALDVEDGTNLVFTKTLVDCSTVWIDHFTKKISERYKMFIKEASSAQYTGKSYTSSDGIHWSEGVTNGWAHDHSTAYFSPFIGKWIYSIRKNFAGQGRCRSLWTSGEFIPGASWKETDLELWMSANDYSPDQDLPSFTPELYGFAAVPYESIMIGLMEVMKGPSNTNCEKTGEPKRCDLCIAYSRDGLKWKNTDKEAFIACSRKKGSWDRGYCHSAGGICTVVGDQLRFYYGAFSGAEGTTDPNIKSYAGGMYYGGAVGVAVLRRDGFVSYEGQGHLVTKPVNFKGKCLFVNADCRKGSMWVEILDSNGNVIPGYTRNGCKEISSNSTITRIEWKGESDISKLAGKDVMFRFILDGGKIYSFWVSADENGASRGYNAAGGPGFTGGTDEEGLSAYRDAEGFLL